MTNRDDSVLDSMQEELDKKPDAAVLLTLNDIEALESGKYPEPSFSLFANASGEEGEEEFARRFTALVCGKFLGKHFPNEAKAGVAKTAGGSVTYDGTFVDPETELRRRKPDTEPLTDGGTPQFDSADIELIEEAYDHLGSTTTGDAAKSDLDEVICRYEDGPVRPAGFSMVSEARRLIDAGNTDRAGDKLNAVIRKLTQK